MDGEAKKLLSNEESARIENAANRTARGRIRPVRYRRRWYILFVFCLMSFASVSAANALGNVANATERAFCWTDADIAIMSAWQAIAFLVSVPFFTWLLDSKGLRAGCLLSAFFLVLGAGIRCISMTPPLSDWLQHTGTFLLSLSSPVAFSAPSLISSNWFPVEQRTTSTAIGVLTSMFGMTFIVLLAPALVHVHDDHKPFNASTILPENSLVSIHDVKDWCFNRSHGNLTDDKTPPQYVLVMRQEIALLMYILFGLCGLSFILTLVYFPSRPPTPPSLSASSPRINFSEGIKSLLRNSNFWLLAFVYSTTTGLPSTLLSILDVLLKAAQIPDDQRVSGYIVCISITTMTVGGILIARIADHYSRFVKHIIITLCFCSTILMLWFALLVDGYIPHNIPSLYISFVLGVALISSAAPVFYEMACECTYPIGEGSTNGLLNVINNLLSLLFLMVLMIPNIGISWMSWTIAGGIGICVPIMAAFKPSYSRLEMDAADSCDGGKERHGSGSQSKREVYHCVN